MSQDTYRGELDTWNLYAYCANDSVNRVDASGHVWETVLDMASIGWSVKDVVEDPSWINAGYLFWEVASTFLPFVPGSYVVKASKRIRGTKIATKISGKILSSDKDLNKKRNLVGEIQTTIICPKIK